MTRTLAVDIGGTKIAAAVVADDATGPEVEHLRTAPTPAGEGAEAVVRTVLELARTVLAAAGAPAVRVGVSSAGTIDPATGRVTHATDTLRGWAGMPLADRLAEGLGAPVAVLNDVHAHGLGEALLGEARGAPSALVVAVGTGIGGCHVLEGRPVLGAHGVAGHVGHVPVPEADGLVCSCGRSGHLEAIASGYGVEAEFARSTGRRLSGREIAALAAEGPTSTQDGDLVAIAGEVLTLAGRATGRVVGGLLNVLDPDVVVVGGGLSAAGAPWRTALLAGVAEQAMDPAQGTPVRFSDLGVSAALHGAAAHARSHLLP
ncbi:ROK family protein [Ornithinimicrobium humiphilum]|uniref:Glucokinase n=1 Tax=Ornithinimicrobium humiphilum TaxID=125288 RepID=A0A543K7S0_9MICO|nr:ROK family protein [Ornithinimicrobium humiphilum]TQM91110.1 glucokinase [Ornithinimicrobium humiphilum]